MEKKFYKVYEKNRLAVLKTPPIFAPWNQVKNISVKGQNLRVGSIGDGVLTEEEVGTFLNLLEKACKFDLVGEPLKEGEEGIAVYSDKRFHENKGFNKYNKPFSRHYFIKVEKVNPENLQRDGSKPWYQNK